MVSSGATHGQLCPSPWAAAAALVGTQPRKLANNSSTRAVTAEPFWNAVNRGSHSIAYNLYGTPRRVRMPAWPLLRSGNLPRELRTDKCLDSRFECNSPRGYSCVFRGARQGDSEITVLRSSTSLVWRFSRFHHSQMFSVK